MWNPTPTNPLSLIKTIGTSFAKSIQDKVNQFGK